MDFGTTAHTATHDHAPELPMLEPTHPQTFDLLDLARRARASRHFSAAVVLVMANDLVYALSRGEDFGRACVDTENAVSDWRTNESAAHSTDAALLALVSLAIEAGAMKNGRSVGVGEADEPFVETPEQSFAYTRAVLSGHQPLRALNADTREASSHLRKRCDRLEAAYLALRAIVRAHRDAKRAN
ncbi:MAG: hypothetical protein NTU45_02640 [Planctomycetota bacterium]|jgi:hypothetical protein|nr:hypothetical protein [Planctomycetota bacterium]